MIEVRTPMADGTLIARIDRKRVVIVTAPQFIGWSVGVSAAAAAHAPTCSCATRCARSCSSPGPPTPSAAARMRRTSSRQARSRCASAARSLIRMRNRIRRYADQRTAMLAGVSHDLRTPLARLKLELALLPKEHDIEGRQGRHRGNGADARRLSRLRARRGRRTAGRGRTSPTLAQEAIVPRRRRARGSNSPRRRRVTMRLRPLAIKARHRQPRQQRRRLRQARSASRVANEAGEAVVSVEDDGPGIPPSLYEDAFRPFSRLDAARNQNVSGVGLGLTIARDTARAHGGDVTLGKSELGGLRATIRLPLRCRRQRPAARTGRRRPRPSFPPLATARRRA